MPNFNRDRPTTTAHNSAHGEHRRDNHPTTTRLADSSLSSTHPERYYHPMIMPSALSDVPSGQTSDTEHPRARQPPIYRNGIRYYLGIDGEYHAVPVVGESGVRYLDGVLYYHLGVDGQYYTLHVADGTSVGVEGYGPIADTVEPSGEQTEEARNGVGATASWEQGSSARSRRPNQGSASPHSTESSHRRDEECYVDDETMNWEDPWSPLQVADHHDDLAVQRDMNGIVAHMLRDRVGGLPSDYPLSIDLEGEENGDGLESASSHT